MPPPVRVRACSTSRRREAMVTGSDSAELEWVCDNHVAREVGDITYTQALNRRGGIESDFTVTRVADDAFMVVTGTAYGSHDISWLRRQARRRGAAARVDDVTGQLLTYALWGPRSRDVLRAVTGADLSNDAFPFMTAQEIAVGDVPVRALRVTFAGELGWELYAPSGVRARAAGEPLGRGAAARAGRRRLPRHREPAAGEGLPGVEHRHHAGDQPLRGGPRLLREARQARRLRGARRRCVGSRRRGCRASARPDAGRPAGGRTGQ